MSDLFELTDEPGLEPDEPALAMTLEPTEAGKSCAAEHFFFYGALRCACGAVERDPEDLSVAMLPEVAGGGLAEVLPPDFQLSPLTKFLPKRELKAEADRAAACALEVAVTGREGIEKADIALAGVRMAIKAIELEFEEPTEIANALHKRLTGLRGEWTEAAKAAVATVGRRMWDEQRRLDAIAAEERRQLQAEADRQAREEARREMEAAKQAQAPAEVVAALELEAATVTAPPVGSAPPPAMKASSTVTRWKARLAGTPGDAEPNPEMADLTPAQRIQVFHLLKAVLLGTAPIQAVTVNWAYLNRRANADKASFSIAGLEAYQEGGIRSKPAARVNGAL